MTSALIKKKRKAPSQRQILPQACRALLNKYFWVSTLTSHSRPPRCVPESQIPSQLTNTLLPNSRWWLLQLVSIWFKISLNSLTPLDNIFQGLSCLTSTPTHTSGILYWIPAPWFPTYSDIASFSFDTPQTGNTDEQLDSRNIFILTFCYGNF